MHYHINKQHKKILNIARLQELVKIQKYQNLIKEIL
jgi:hypothetical protein